MAQLKAKDLKRMGKSELDIKLGELKFELVRSKANASKTGSSKTKEIKKMIARIKTLEKLDKKNK